MNLAVQRIMKEISDLKKDPPDNFLVMIDDEDIFTFFFTLRGSPGSDFDGGLYHGKIILPSDYPLRAPDLIFITVGVLSSRAYLLAFRKVPGEHKNLPLHDELSS